MGQNFNISHIKIEECCVDLDSLFLEKKTPDAFLICY